MNSSKHLLFGLLVLVLGLLAIATYQWLGAPKLDVVAERSAASEKLPDSSSGSLSKTQQVGGNQLGAATALQSTVEASAETTPAATAEEAEPSADARLYEAVAELENRLRGYIDDAVDRASEQSQAPSADELGEQVAARVMASIREESPGNEDVDRINAMTASGPPAAIDSDQEPLRLQQVHFLNDSSELTPGAQRKAREAAEWFRSNDPSKIRVVGFSDTRGSADYNLALSQRRADSVAALLVRAGIPEDRLEIEGLGESRLPEPTGDGVAEPLNRCVGIMAIQ